MTVVLDLIRGEEEEGRCAVDTSVRGVVNIGNTCFAAVVLQSLAGCPSFVTYVAAIATVAASEDALFTQELHRILTDLAEMGVDKCRGDGPLDPSTVLELAREKSAYSSISTRSSYMQQDADEFLHLLFDLVEKEERKLWMRRSRSMGVAELLGARTWKNPFNGTLVQEKTCRSCARTAPFRISNVAIIPLPAVSRFGKIELTSLAMALEEFTLSETVTGVHCEFCNNNRDANRKLLFGKLPRALCLHVQRKAYDSSLNTMKKLNHMIDVPHVLDLASVSFASHVQGLGGVLLKRSAGSRCEYNLSSVVEHLVGLDAKAGLTRLS